MHKIRQIVPQDVCLTCDVCCRFVEKESRWRPVFAVEEKNLINKNLSLDKTSKINLIPYKHIYICPCFLVEENKCKVYDLRPFDCRLYPFLLIKRGHQVYLGIDKKCPYTKVIFAEEKKSGFVNYLEKELTKGEIIRWLKANPSLFCVYDNDTLELAYLFDL